MSEFTCDGHLVAEGGSPKTLSTALDELINLVRSLASEWGSENLLITLPMDWHCIGLALNEARKRQFAFTTDATIEVSIYVNCVRKFHHVVSAESLYPI